MYMTTSVMCKTESKKLEDVHAHLRRLKMYVFARRHRTQWRR